MNYSSFTDAWEQSQIESQGEQRFISENPAFQMLTLREDGSYSRLGMHNREENGKWTINRESHVLTLKTNDGVQMYRIVKLPNKGNEDLVLKENQNSISKFSKIKKYELTRVRG